MNKRVRPRNAVLALSTLTIFAIVLAVTLLLADLRKRELQHAHLETLSITNMLMENTVQAFDGIDQVLRGVQERLQSSVGKQFSLDSPEVHLLLSARIAGVKQVNGLFIINSDGIAINSSRDFPISPIDLSDRDYFKAFSTFKHNGLFVGKPVRKRVDNSWAINLARFVSDADGGRGVIVVAAVDLQYFEKLYDSLKIDFVRPIMLYFDDGTLVASLPRRENMIGDRAPELTGETMPVDGEAPRLVTHISGDGSQQIFSLGHVARFPMVVSVADDQEEALSSWRETAFPIVLGSGVVCLFVLLVAAILMRELAREEKLATALNESYDRYQRTIDSVMDAIVGVDKNQSIVFFNPSAESMFGLAAEKAIGSQLERLIPERLRGAHRHHIVGFMHTDVRSRTMAPSLEISGLRADGNEFPIEATISQTLIGGEPQYTAVLRDVTERRNAETELRKMNRQLQDLSASLQDIREQERSRIARELHDDLGQQLTGLKLELSWLSNRLKEGRPAPPEKMDTMRHQLDDAIAAVRRISTELRPLILDDLGFGEAVVWQAGVLSKRTGLEIDLDLSAAGLVKDDVLATALFRVLQESLTNIVRHANAERVEIRLVVEGDNLVLTVRDNGRGIAAGVVKGGIGLVSMRERATALGGQFNISSVPGDGTVIEVRVPNAALIATWSNE